MWWKKEIDNHTTLVIMRIAVAAMYMYVSCYFSFSSESNLIAMQGFKIISNFCLILAAVNLFPVVESIYAEENKYFVNMLSVTFAFFAVLIMHVYLLNSFGITQTYNYIFGSFCINVFAQFPIIFLLKKVYAKNS